MSAFWIVKAMINAVRTNLKKHRIVFGVLPRENERACSGSMSCQTDAVARTIGCRPRIAAQIDSVCDRNKRIGGNELQISHFDRRGGGNLLSFSFLTTSEWSREELVGSM